MYEGYLKTILDDRRRNVIVVTIYTASIVSCSDIHKSTPSSHADDHRRPHLNLIQITALLRASTNELEIHEITFQRENPTDHINEVYKLKTITNSL